MNSSSASQEQSRFSLLCLGALGVVFGDIGTSPIYAFRESYRAMGGAENGPHREALILGVLSMIIWSLVLIISIKYVLFILKADKRGEGGTLALLSVGFPERKARWRSRTSRAIVILGVFGSGLLYGDGIITPAITVLSAVEGLNAHPINLPLHYIVPITSAILAGLFAVQRHGTSLVGRAFGPVTLLWFLTIAILGAIAIWKYPSVLRAFSPHYAVQFFFMEDAHAIHPLLVMGGVCLVITGGEALYADMGHFGRRPIRFTWFVLVLPALLINYLGQAALILAPGGEAMMANPFFSLAPDSLRLALVILATAAGVIASQALITGSYSVTMQAIQLGYLPRMKIEHTSSVERGQIYVSRINWILAVLCILLVYVFKTSSNLAHAYGMAVTLTMFITTVLFYFAARRKWEWPRWKALTLCLFFGFVELAFVCANFLKFFKGAWFPLAVGLAVFIIMVTWRSGRRILSEKLNDQALPLKDFVASIERGGAHRVPGAAVFMAGTSGITPTALLHNLKHNKVIHQRVIFLTIDSELIPYVKEEDRLTVEQITDGMYRVIGHFGFMEQPQVPALLEKCEEKGLKLDPMKTSFFLGRETIIPSNKHLAKWRSKLFGILSRNAQSAVAYYSIPPSRVVEFGIQIEL